MGWMVFIYAFWILSAVFGNEFIQFSIGPINPFYILVFSFIGYFVVLRCIAGEKLPCKGSQEVAKWSKTLLLCFAWQGIYVFLSGFNLFTRFFSLDLEYEFSYVFRQGYLILVFPMIYVLVYKVALNPACERFLMSRKIQVYVWIILVVAREVFRYDTIAMRSMAFFVACMIVVQKKNYWSYFIFIYTCARLISLGFYSSSVLALIAALICINFTYITNWFSGRSYIWLKIICIILLVIIFLLVVIFFSFLYNNYLGWLSGDSNAEWRWQYWVNEFHLLVKSCFMGVGYGTAYASSSIYNEINNTAMLMNGGVFVVTQHNSFVNIAFRLGVVGVIVFIKLWIVHPFQWYLKIYKGVDDSTKKFLKILLANLLYNIVICATNPGLESPRFAIGFIISYAFFIGFLLKYDGESDDNNFQIKIKV